MLLAAAAAAALGMARPVDSIPVGQWGSYINSLPDMQLPHVPLLGNGHIGIALNSRSSSSGVVGADAGPGSANTLDLWLGSTSFWSCTSCGSVDPDNDVPACCSTVALGGVSLRFTSTFPAAQPLPAFAAEQRLVNGELYTRWGTANGGAIESWTRVHPTADVVVTNVSWTPGAGDPAALAIDVSTWVLGNGTVKGSWNTGVPAPASVGCASADGATMEACAGIIPNTQPQLVYVSRNASTVDADVMPVSAALATGVLITGGSGGVTWGGSNVTSYEPVYPPNRPWEATQRITLQAGAWALIATAEAESRGPGLRDPSPAALAQVAGVMASPPGSVAAAADAWWSAFWARSSVSLPSQPGIEQFWYGAQYILACTSSANPNVAAPGLYGPWVTVDGPNWHGDYTLDYNYQTPYFGAFASNHPQQAEAYWGPIVDWMGPGRIKAQAQASYAGVTCPASALYYACHLAPWGLMSLDGMTKYMVWNGHFAALPFISHWDYTRNASFASAVTYPLLDGLNAWWACYLNKTAVNGSYVFNDNNSHNPDYEHEGQPVPNPQIALGFIYRTITAQLEIAAALGMPPPPSIADIAAHLPPLNTATVNVSSNTSFQILPNTRCHDDDQTWYDVASVEACQALCAGSQPGCGVFSYCPPAGQEPAGGGCSGAHGEPAPQTCWGFDIKQLPNCVTNATLNGGWTSGVRNGTSPPVPVSIWTAFQGADKAASDWFSCYPLWPTEALDLGPNAAAAAAPILLALRSIAQASSRVYSDFVNGRPVDLFAMAVRAGSGNTSALSSWTPSDVITGFNGYLAHYQGPNLLPYAPGGGIENIGISIAVNDMLLQANRWPTAGVSGSGVGLRGFAKHAASSSVDDSGYVLTLFPFWPRDQPASFTSLLAKGGFLVSAVYDNATQAVSPVAITAAHVLSGATASVVRLVNPWPQGGALSVTCGGSPVPVSWEHGGAVAVFTAPAQVPCAVSVGA